jgi:hypothetical protein
VTCAAGSTGSDSPVSEAVLSLKIVEVFEVEMATSILPHLDVTA